MANLSRARLKRLTKEGGWILVGQAVSVAGTLALVRILTEYLEPSEYGKLALGLTIAGLFHQVIFGAVGNGIGRYYATAAEAKDVRGYLDKAGSLLAYSATAALFVCCCLLAGLSIAGQSHWNGLVLLAFLFAIFGGYNSAINGIQNAARQRAVVAFHGGLGAWLKTLFVVLAMSWIGSTTEIVIIGYPIDAVKEFSRLLRKGGTLILTAPSNCLRHMDPYFYYSGFSDRWFERVLDESGFFVKSIDPVGDYYRWLAVELARTLKSESIFASPFLIPAFFYYYLKRPSRISIDTLCMGYHIVAIKK